MPGTQDKVIIALKSEELEGKIATYVLVYNIDGTILYPETKIGDLKFEGVEFVWRIFEQIWKIFSSRLKRKIK